jgi:serine/threonine protein kinase
MSIIYESPLDAIYKITNINKNSIKKLFVAGIENDGIYLYEDRIFKVAISKREYLAAQRIIGKDFKNVVKIHSATEITSYLYENSYETAKSYIIEEERLFRDRKSYVFDDLDISFVSVDVNRRLPYFVSVLNGLAELASVGIVHGDLHSMNIMMDKNNEAKIIDFGFSKLKKTFGDVKVRAQTLLL